MALQATSFCYTNGRPALPCESSGATRGRAQARTGTQQRGPSPKAQVSEKRGSVGGPEEAQEDGAGRPSQVHSGARIRMASGRAHACSEWRSTRH
eukprot:225781-Pyramimonas_sp.AAC.1